MSEKDKRSLTSPNNGKNGGVKTDQGKAITRLNATKHGIFSITENDYDDISFDEAYLKFAEEFGDDTPSRSVLISQVAILFIRLKRCQKFENEFILSKLYPPKYENKLVKKGEESFFKSPNLDGTPDVYEAVMVDAGKPMSAPLEVLYGLDNLFTKYEPQFLTRFCSLIDYLTQSKK